MVENKSKGNSSLETSQVIPEVISAVIKETAAALDAVQDLERRGVEDIIVDFAERGDLGELNNLTRIANDQISEMQQSLGRLIERGRSEYEYWREIRRFDPRVVEQILAELRLNRSAKAARTWFVEVIEALYRHEYKGALQLAQGLADVDTEPLSTLKEMADYIRRWSEGDSQAALDICRLLDQALDSKTYQGGKGLPRGTKEKITLLAASAKQQAGLDEDAVQTMDVAIHALRAPTILQAERAGLSLVLGQGNDATKRARSIVEHSPGNPYGYFHLGACIEQAGDFLQAIGLYEEGCTRSTVLTLHRLGTGTTFLKVTGLLHYQRAMKLAEYGHTHEALQAADDAVDQGLASKEPYPNGPVYEFRANVLASLGRQQESAEAAFSAGQEYLLNGDADSALHPLENAWQAERAIRGAGWYYADALCATSWPNGEPNPDFSRLLKARRVWEDEVASSGSPTADDAWAYGVRANISERLSYIPGNDQAAADWEALIYVEKALLLDDTAAEIWGLCARLFRRVTMDSVALVCTDRGFMLDPDNLTVLEERLALLANSGLYVQADETLRRIPGKDTDPWLIGVHAWLLYHQGHYAQAISELDVPLMEGFNLGWSLDLRASCQIQVGAIKAAREDLKRLLKVDTNMGVDSTLRRAQAFASLGDSANAVREFDRIRSDDPISSTEREATQVTIHLARNDVYSARLAAEKCLNDASNAREIDDALTNWRDCIALLTDKGADMTAATQMVAELADRRSSQREAVSENETDAEIGRVSAQHAAEPPGSNPRIAISAISALGILPGSKDLQYAEGVLRGLQGTILEPEVSGTLGKVLQQRLVLAVSRGDEFEARHFYEELARHGEVLPSPVEVVVAEALAAKGLYTEAIDKLAAARELVIQERWAVPVDILIGEYDLRVGRIDEALSALSRAGNAARTAEDWPALAHIMACMATAATLRGVHDSAVEYLADGLRTLQQSGAATPSLILGHELATVAQSTGAASILGKLVESLALAIEQVDPREQCGREWLAAIINASDSAATT